MKPKLIVSVISGFTQDATRMNGMIKAAQDTIALSEELGEFIRVEYYTHDDSMEGAAQFAHRMWPGVPHITMGYSLGGEGAAKLANALFFLGENVQGCIVVDGVVDGGVVTTWNPFKWRPWRWIWGKIKIEEGAGHPHSYIQRRNKPDGDKVMYGSRELKQVDLTDGDRVDHNNIDEHPLVHETLKRLIYQALGKEYR